MEYSSDIKAYPSDYLIGINNCGEIHADEELHICRSAGRNDYQLIYVAGGYCVITINGTVQIAAQGDCILYRPGETQDYQLSQKAETHTYWVHFNGNICKSLLERLSLQNICIIKAEKLREIEYHMAGICKHFHLKAPGSEVICSGLMQTVLGLLSNEACGKQQFDSNKKADRISELISQIKATPNLKISVSECADFCHMSKPHFTRIFRRTTGASPMQFLLGIRVERAKELLDFTDKPIMDIAEASGFQDQNYFARTFKKFTGMSPTQYRKAK